jgi:hypothetical protein
MFRIPSAPGNQRHLVHVDDVGAALQGSGAIRDAGPTTTSRPVLYHDNPLEPAGAIGRRQRRAMQLLNDSS